MQILFVLQDICDDGDPDTLNLESSTRRAFHDVCFYLASERVIPN